MPTFTYNEVSILSEIIRIAYSDILSSEAWLHMLALLDTVVPSDASAAIFINPQTRRPERYANRGFDVKMYDEYEQYYHRLDLPMSKARLVLKAWQPTDLMPRDEWEKTEIYSEYLVRYGCRQVATSALAVGADDPRIWFRLARNSRHPFTKREMQYLRLLHPHLTSALEKAEALSGLQQEKNRWKSAYDQVNRSIFLFGEDLDLLYMNPKAKSVFGNEDPSLVREALREEIRSVDVSSPGETIRRVGCSAYRLSMAHIRPEDSPAYWIVAAEDMGENLRWAFDKALDAYGISSRECEVCGMLINGLSNREIAERLFISELTVKDHVKSILAKLQVPSRNRIAAKLLGL